MFNPGNDKENIIIAILLTMLFAPLWLEDPFIIKIFAKQLYLHLWSLNDTYIYYSGKPYTFYYLDRFLDHELLLVLYNFAPSYKMYDALHNMAVLQDINLENLSREDFIKFIKQDFDLTKRIDKELGVLYHVTISPEEPFWDLLVSKDQSPADLGLINYEKKRIKNRRV